MPMARRCAGTGIRSGSLPCLHRIHEERLPCGRKPAQLHLTGRSDRNAIGSQSLPQNKCWPLPGAGAEAHQYRPGRALREQEARPQQLPPASAGNGALDGAEEDPAAAFLAQQENEIAGIENDEGYSILESGEVPAALHVPEGLDSGAVDGVVNGDVYQESNGPTDSYAAISQVDRLQSEPESIRKWREEQKERLEQLDANSRKQEAEWKEKAIKELEEWYARQDEKLQKTKASNRVADEAFYKQPFADVIGYVAAEEAFVNDAEDIFPGTEWERVAQLCDFNPKSSKQAKDVSRMRSVLISLKQAPLVR
ncbi:PREDICTED: clathrin light chain A [Aptenodytes forsteri]|nr:PREDICTED: clathrin light chain A [Aptenodytes forsteri]